MITYTHYGTAGLTDQERGVVFMYFRYSNLSLIGAVNYLVYLYLLCSGNVSA